MRVVRAFIALVALAALVAAGLQAYRHWQANRGQSDGSTGVRPFAEGGAGPRPFVPRPAPDPGSELVLELVEDPATHYGEHPWTEADAVYRDAVAGLDGVVYDAALGHAARELAAFYALEGTMAPSGALHFVLGSAGSAEWDVLRSMVVTRRTDQVAIRERVSELADRERERANVRAPGAPIEVGVGEAYTLADPGARYVAVIVSRGELVVEPLARRQPLGVDARVAGVLPPGADGPRLAVMWPDGHMADLEATFDARSRRFEARVATGDTEGPLAIEILATTATGPHPLAQLDLHVGAEEAPLPTVFEGQWAPDETDIATAEAAADVLEELVDLDRDRYGLPPFQRDPALDAVAHAHSEDMRQGGWVGHVSPTTGSVGDRLRAAGYRAVGYAENVARNRSLWDAQQGLMHSVGHRSNLLAPTDSHTHVGLAAVPATGGGPGAKRQWYVTQVFARPLEAVDAAALETRIVDAIDRLRVDGGGRALKRDRRLDAVAQRAAEGGEPTPRAALEQAEREGLTRRGAWASVVTLVTTQQYEVPEAVLREDVRRIGVGVFQDVDAPPPNIVVVVLTAG